MAGKGSENVTRTIEGTHALRVQFLWRCVVVLGRAVVDVDAQRVSPLGNGRGGDIVTLPKLDRSTQAPVDAQGTLNLHLSTWQLQGKFFIQYVLVNTGLCLHSKYGCCIILQRIHHTIQHIIYICVLVNRHSTPKQYGPVSFQVK